MSKNKFLISIILCVSFFVFSTPNKVIAQTRITRPDINQYKNPPPPPPSAPPVSYTHLDVYKRQPLDLGDVDIRDVLQQSQEIAGSKLSHSQIHINIGENDGGIIRADDKKIRQIMFNLLHNACLLYTSRCV